MTTGLRFTRHDRTPAQHVQVLRKEIELIGFEMVGHKHVIARLRQIHDLVALTTEQARELSQEMAWRRAEMKRLRDGRQQKRSQLRAWVNRAAHAAERTRRVQNDHERRVA